MKRRFRNKAAARDAIWDHLRDERLARFPFPPHGRIPNFKDAKRAALRLLEVAPWRDARAIKVNPDAPQRYLREEALRRGIVVFVPTPRLRGGFQKFDPARIPLDKIAEAASLSRGTRWGEAVALEDMPQLDAIVAGSPRALSLNVSANATSTPSRFVCCGRLPTRPTNSPWQR